MLSDTLQHADLNAALQPYYSEMRFDTFPVNSCCWEGGGGRGVVGSDMGQGWEEEDGWYATRNSLV